MSTYQTTTLKDQANMQERRERIYGMYLRGSSETEIAEVIGVNQSTVSRALEVMRKKNQDWFSQYRDQPSYVGALVTEQKDRLTGLVREAWTLYEKIDGSDLGKKIQALSLVKNSITGLGAMLGLELPNLSHPDNFYILDQFEDTTNKTTEIVTLGPEVTELVQKLDEPDSQSR